MTVYPLQLLQLSLNPNNTENFWAQWAGNLTLGCNSFIVLSGFYDPNNSSNVNTMASCPYSDTALVRCVG